jgi:hypothetical protein
MFLPPVFQDMMSRYTAGHAPLEMAESLHMSTQIELSIVKYHVYIYTYVSES